MERIRRGLEALMQNRRGGVSMIVAVCAGVLLLGLTSSLLYAASLPMARANRKIGQERCRQLSASFAQVLDGELRRYVTDDSGVRLKPGETCAPASGTFYNYTNQVLEDDMYGEYDPTDPDSGLFYQTMAGGGGEDYGEITIQLRKTSLEDSFEDAVKQEKLPYNSYGDFEYEERRNGTGTAEHTEFIRCQFAVDAAVKLEDDSSHTSTEYYRKDSFQPVYTWHTTNSIPDWVHVDTEFRVYWNGEHFYKDSNFATLMEPRYREKWETVELEDGGTAKVLVDTWKETVNISYVYYESDGRMTTTYKRYVPVYEERSGEGGSGSETP